MYYIRININTARRLLFFQNKTVNSPRMCIMRLQFKQTFLNWLFKINDFSAIGHAILNISSFCSSGFFTRCVYELNR